ncbi:MAG TPA: hypothetical protein PLD25_10510 [Chloroflexota bacterium]|nr:hypothetical protein [Chloroflexota bacterium]HUM67546.1 hypothetical protein [Chloroflexota bacterium]
MISIRIDVNGAQHVQWPKKPANILALGQAYVTYEASLPVGQQLAAPSLAVMQAANTAAQTAQAAADTGENARALAAETYRQTMTTAKRQLEIALGRLKGNHITNLAALQQWGLDTVSTSTGVSVRKPRTDPQWEAFLNAYVSKETSLPANEQITDPSLSEMTQLRDDVQAARAARTSGKNQREFNVLTRTAETQRLLDLLQTAAVNMVVLRHNGVVSNALQSWGYVVTAVTPTPAPPVEPPVEEPGS